MDYFFQIDYCFGDHANSFSIFKNEAFVVFIRKSFFSLVLFATTP